MPATAVTHLAVFGAPRISRDGSEIAMPVRKALALFVYLALEGRSSRARLAGMFWSGLDEPTARRNLRHALHRLRSAGLGDVLSPTTRHRAGRVGNDLQAFEQAAAAGRSTRRMPSGPGPCSTDSRSRTRRTSTPG